MRLKISPNVSSCPVCGFTMPNLEICSLASSCAMCARSKLGDVCDTCPDRAKCDIALEGIKFLKNLEYKLDIYIDISREIIKRAERYNRAELAMAFMKALVGLAKALESHEPAAAFPAWLRSVFRPSALRKLIKTPYLVDLETEKYFKYFCREFKCEGLESPLANLFNSLISLSLLEGVGDPSAYFGV